MRSDEVRCEKLNCKSQKLNLHKKRISFWLLVLQNSLCGGKPMTLVRQAFILFKSEIQDSTSFFSNFEISTLACFRIEIPSSG